MLGSRCETRAGRAPKMMETLFFTECLCCWQTQSIATCVSEVPYQHPGPGKGLIGSKTLSEPIRPTDFKELLPEQDRFCKL